VFDFFFFYFFQGINHDYIKLLIYNYYEQIWNISLTLQFYYLDIIRMLR